MPDYQYYRNVFAAEKLPLAYVDLDLLDRNAAEIAARAAGKQIRLASKSVRCRAILQRILDSDAVYRGLMSFTADEALHLLDHGFDDVLVAYPTVYPPHIKALAERAAAGARVYLMVDRKEHLDIISAAIRELEVTLPVCIDLDMSVDLPGLHFGVWRSSIRSLHDLRQFVQYANGCPQVEIRGVMGYEAQIAGLGDAVDGKPLMNRVVKRLKAYAIPKIARFRGEAIAFLQSQGIELDLINGGGTGSIDSTTAETWITEVTVGSGFYNSHLFDYYSQFRYAPAAGFAIPITRIPKPGTYTCLGGGYIASGAVDRTKAPKPYLPDGAALVENEGAGEVQTPINYDGPETLHIGDPILLRHSKAGELCERFNELHLIQSGRIVDRVPTYRGEGKCFL